MELVNIDADVIDQIYKKASISLCSNVVGQVNVGLMVNPPQPGSQSYDLYHSETSGIYGLFWSSLCHLSHTVFGAFDMRAVHFQED
jgi:hypothetical protein